MTEYKESFKDYLRQNGYKEFTPSGNPSTVYDYAKRIDYIIWLENFSSWQDVADNIDRLLKDYGEFGARAKEGKKSHCAVINALKRFSEFLSAQNHCAIEI